MTTLNDGQCGLCLHFGEHASHDSAQQDRLVQIRSSKQAPEDFRDECGHPRLEPLHLIVTPVSGCEGFEAAQAA